MKTKVEDIEVNRAETVGSQIQQGLTNKPIDIEGLSDAELERILAYRKEQKDAENKAKKAAFEKQKEKFISDTVSQFRAASELLVKLKADTITQANELFKKMFEVNGKELKEQNTFTFKSDDGKMKVQVERQERFEFTEEAIVHINSIRDIFRAKFQDRNKGFYNLLDGILMKNSKGDYDAKLLTKARKQVNDLGDAALIEEFDKLVDCQRVTGSSTYCRAYAVDENGKWQDINVQFSSL
ncbi:DUF3164 family protein [Flavobacterium alkalisoli]|uniref:DUF3164 family protein n=1 Tax=Flavobacterium alkalisoli TaxID=2602769 RepID=A0A5B9FVR4_9FLAO|nr:DUF3164 family protein [Flavobacterium alkalisoli]QEE51064.1 DUF3164 family protein [Flavobacterium alkalisoli]